MLPPAGGRVPLALATGPGSCVDNPCDPFCLRYSDDAPGLTLDADAGLVTTSDGKLQLVPQEPGTVQGEKCTGIALTPATATFRVTDIPTGSTGVTAEYFNYNYSNSGGRTDTTDLNVSRFFTLKGNNKEAQVNTNFGNGSPGIAGVGNDNFAIRYTGSIYPPTTDAYYFYLTGDDGIRLWINGTLVINKWITQGPTEYATAALNLTGGTPVDFKVEYFEAGGGATVSLGWKSSTIAKQIIPATSYVVSAGDPTITPSTIQFKPTVIPASCYDGEVTAAFSIDRLDSATIDDTGVVRLFSPVAGPIQVKGYAGDHQAQATANVVVDVRDVSAAPANAVTALAQATTGSDVATYIYPYEGTVFPLSMQAPVIQWSDGGQAASAVEVGLRYPATGTAVFNYRLVISESSPPRAVIPQLLWEYFGRTAKGKDAAITLQRVVGGSPRNVISRTIRFATAPLRGRIYYTEYPRGGSGAEIMAADPGSTSGAVRAFASADGCPVCHSMSANGTRFATADRSFSTNFGGLASVAADGSLSPLSDMPTDAAYKANANDWRGFAWAPIVPDGSLLLAANNIWGNARQSVVGIDSSRVVNVDAGYYSQGSGIGLRAEYYNNTTFTGNPFIRHDPAVDFNWNNTAPAPSIANDNFSVRWVGKLQPLFTENVTFSVTTEVGVTVRVGGVVVIDASGADAASSTYSSAAVALQAGSLYDIVVQATEGAGSSASLALSWSGLRTSSGRIPTTQLYPPSDALGLTTTYFTTNDFNAANKLLTRQEMMANASWSATAIAGLPSSGNWSTDWVGRISLPIDANYRFYITGDDWAELYLDSLVTPYLTSSGAEVSTPAAGKAMTPGIYDLRIRHKNTGGNGRVLLRWSATGKAADAGRSLSTAVVPFGYLLPPTTYVEPANGLRASYYDAQDFNVAQSQGATLAALRRVETDFVQSYGVERAEFGVLTSSDSWCGRYTGSLTPPCDGIYEFEVQADDDARLWVNGNRVIANWEHLTESSGGLYLTGGVVSDFKLDYCEASGSASMSLKWKAQCLGDNSFGTIPLSYLTPTQSSSTAGFLRGKSNVENGSGNYYYVWSMPSAAGSPPVDLTGDTRARWGLGNSVMMVPTFSPNGQQLVFVDGDPGGGAGWRKGLSTFQFDQGQKRFYSRKGIVNSWPSGDVIKWPTFESDSRSVIYHTTTPGDQCCRGGWTQYGHMAPTNYYEDPGRLYSVDTLSASPVPVELATLNRGERAVDANKAYQATALPTSSAGYRWVVFTSTRPYGNTVNLEASQNSYADPVTFTSMVKPTETQSQLWVAAIDDEASGVRDRSHPGFWLPNQRYDATAGKGYINERGYWALDPCKPVGSSSGSICQVDEDCCGGIGATPTSACRIDVPVSSPPTRHCQTLPSQSTCQLPGGACATTTECCNGYVCANASCEKPPDLAVFFPANYERVYEAACGDGNAWYWRFFHWNAVTPSDSYIEFYAETMPTSAGFHTLPLAPAAVSTTGVMYLGSTKDDIPARIVDVAAKITASNLKHGLFLKLTARLMPSTLKTATPSLTDWEQSFTCPPAQ